MVDTAPVAVVGVVGGEVVGADARERVEQAEVLVGAPRHLAYFEPSCGPQLRIDLAGPIDQAIDAIAGHVAEGRTVCVLASGDPGFFGIVRLMSARLESPRIRVHPAPSSVALAWGVAGLHWDDAEVVSAHGRSLAQALPVALTSPKVAILTDPSNPPELIARELLARGSRPRKVIVASRLGEPDQSVVHTDLSGASAGSFDPLSVMLVIDEGDPTDRPSIAWGWPERKFARRDGMITKSEVRAVALGKLSLPRTGVLWDVGAGSGSVGIEAAALSRALRVYAVERHGADAERIAANAAAAGVAVDVITGDAPDALAGMPDPDRVFVGGGGLDVVEASWKRLGSGGVLVATFVLLDRAVEAHRLLGDMVQIHVNRCVPIGSAGVRLEPLNPVFVCWGER